MNFRGSNMNRFTFDKSELQKCCMNLSKIVATDPQDFFQIRMIFVQLQILLFKSPASG
jgi:hypothetical protein